jgi:formylmethanofuran dehydrogenase subunit B
MDDNLTANVNIEMLAISCNVSGFNEVFVVELG